MELRLPEQIRKKGRSQTEKDDRLGIGKAYVMADVLLMKLDKA
jgi:hypothetical protein